MKTMMGQVFAIGLVWLGLLSLLQAEGEVIDLPMNLDKERKRNVPMSIHLPEEKMAQPVVLLSHGAAGSRHGFYALAAELAKQGYVAICLEHVTSNTGNIRKRMQSKALGFREAVLDSGEDLTPRKNRPLDVKFALDLVERWNREDERFKGRFDITKIAVLGHSYGAYTTMVSCGVKPIGLEGDFSDSRIKLGIALSPQSANGKFFNKESFKGVTRPFVGISGTRDVEKERHRDFFKLMPEKEKHLIWFYDAYHFSFSDPTGGPRRLAKVDEDVTRALKILIPEVLAHYLRGGQKLDEALRTKLTEQSVQGSVRRVEWQTR